MKKLITVVLCLVLMLGCTTLFTACSGDENTSSETELGFVYELKTDDNNVKYLSVKGYNVSDEVAELVADKNYSDEKVVAVSTISIPTGDVEYKRNGEVIGTYPVKEVAESAFANMLFIKEVVIPANVETIGNACLAGCTNLEKLTVNFVGKTASGSLNDAKTLSYLFGVSETTGATASTVYYNATGSKTVYIPDSLKTVVLTGDNVSEYAFSGFSCLEEVQVPLTVSKIGAYAFKNCSSLYKFTIGAEVTEVCEGAFQNCSSLVNVGLEGATKLATIGDYAFNGCTLLNYSVKGGVYMASANLKYIGLYAFSGCNSFETVNLSQLTGDYYVSSYGFASCTGVQKVIMPAGATSDNFAKWVFHGCDLKAENVDGYNGSLSVFDYEYNA